jgi:hypothetical protein
VVDAFLNEEARQAHLEGGQARLAGVADVLTEPPSIVRTQVIAAKLPSDARR